MSIQLPCVHPHLSRPSQVPMLLAEEATGHHNGCPPAGEGEGRGDSLGHTCYHLMSNTCILSMTGRRGQILQCVLPRVWDKLPCVRGALGEAMQGKLERWGQDSGSGTGGRWAGGRFRRPPAEEQEPQSEVFGWRGPGWKRERCWDSWRGRRGGSPLCSAVGVGGSQQSD